MNRSLLAAALMAAASSPLHRLKTNQPDGPAPRKFWTVDRSAPTCEKGCMLVPTTLEDGREVKTISHVPGCRVAIAAHNQAVDNRQVRRAYARIMAKRGAE